MNKEKMIADEAEKYGKKWALFGSKEALAAAFTDGANYAMSLSNWIRVEDRLPEELGYYLIYNGELVTELKFMNGRFWSNSIQCIIGITHWQPLPTPPVK